MVAGGFKRWSLSRTLTRGQFQWSLDPCIQEVVSHYTLEGSLNFKGGTGSYIGML